MIPLRYNLRSLLCRKTRTALTSAGIGLSVLVAISMLALATGMMNSIQRTGDSLNVLVTSRGAETVEFSSVDRQIADILRFSPFVSLDHNEMPLASPELYAIAVIEKHAGAPTGQALIRGVLPVALEVHAQINVIEGGFPTEPGEIMAGPLAAAQIGIAAAALDIGKTIDFDGRTWTVTGRFDAPGTAYESELWAPLDELMTAARRTELSSIVLRTPDEDSMEEFLFDLELRTDVLVTARKETNYYAGYAEAYKPVLIMVYLMAGMLTLGGVFIGMNTVFATLSGRVREIGILRTIGYSRIHIAAAFLIESIIPALAGGLLASLLATAMNGFALRIPMGAFRLHISPSLFGIAMGLSLLIGILGAAIPILHAVRLKTIDAIRHL